MQQFFLSCGFDALCFHGEGAPTSKSNINFSSKMNKLLGVLSTRLKDNAGFNSKSNTKKLISELEIYKPDLFIIHNLHAYYVHIGMLFEYISKKRIPVIFVLHDCWLFTGHCAHFDYIGCYKWKKTCFNCPQIQAYPASWFLDRSKINQKRKKEFLKLIQNKIFVTPSIWLKELAQESFLRENVFYVINNGINTEQFKRREIKNKNKIITILCVANIWNEKKGILDIIKLSQLVDDRFEITIVGKLKKTYRFNNKIRYIKQTTDINNLVSLYSAADVFFNPTYEDNYPTVNIEALSCGCPVVCYKTGGAYEMLSPDFVVEKGDIQSAFLKIQEITSGRLVYRFDKNGKFDKIYQLNQYLKLVNMMLKL